jgi:agmatine deiminase
MPAEWEAHDATWLSWPRREGISFPDAYDAVMPAFRKMIDSLRESEPVRINVRDEDHEQEVRTCLKQIDLSHVQFFHIPTNEPWCRDHGPIFIRNDAEQKLAIVDWDYNAWGGKYPPFDLDEVVPTRIGEQLGLPVHHPGLIMEGGSIEPNGKGTLLTTRSCLLNPNRNPGRTKDEIEHALADYLGITHFLWLGDGIEGDDTDGHIDDIARFVGHGTILTAIEEDPSDTNYEPLQANLEILKGMFAEDGTPLNILGLPMPPRLEKEGLRLPASYANFYIANKVVLLPVFHAASDEKAFEALQFCFPDRRIVPIDCRELVWGLGAFHCLTQQQPRITAT